MEDFTEKIAQLNCKTVSELSNTEPNGRVRIAGVVSDFTVRNTKKGDRYAFFRLEDITGLSAKCVLWPEAFKAKGQDVDNDALILVSGKRDESEGSLTVVCDEVTTLEKARIPVTINNYGQRTATRVPTKSLVIKFPASANLEELTDAVFKALLSWPGDCDVLIEMRLREENLLVRARAGQALRVSPDQALQDALLATGVKIEWEESLAVN